MNWTTIWSHAHRGIAGHSPSERAVHLTLRQIAPVKSLRFVFANTYGSHTQQIQELTVITNEQQQRIPDFSLSPGELVTTAPVTIDSSARKWQLHYRTNRSESGFPAIDADFLASPETADFCSGLAAIEAVVEGTCVLALGDSLTEGATWTTPLQRTLRKQNIFLVNQGINGSRLLEAASDQPTTETQRLFYGFAAMQRLRASFASHRNVSKVMLSIGINDLINGALTLASFQKGIGDLIQLCQGQNCAYQLCTLMPCLGYPGMDQRKEAVRQEINRWLLANYTDVWDFSSMVENGQGQLNPMYDSGDHLHVNAIAGLTIARQISSDFVKGV